MDRRRAAGALLALAAYIATTTAAPTASGNHTALDLYDGHTEGCYYNFRHYAEGERIMTNEPCLNCTCHNRMLMCYLRVCPFTKAIGQDCTVEKRADQCCPIVTCPDVPVDLLTSTSTSSPAEYGSTGVGKLDNYGCTINGKYLPEGAKVPQSPGKPCEHCYCIRNMTTCVMQECTLHVDGCTPIYAKDVCCPIRYFCDHPDEEMPALDDMTTTVRPTPGFLLTTTTTEEPTTLAAKRDCIEGDQLYPDGALIKTEKPCEHCYCMKGDIVCVVQECGTPMENEGKNCTSLPPREGQCCPDTYICEGDEVTTEAPFEEITTIPPRRAGVEGSGYRHDDDLPFTEVPTFEIEGSGEEDIATEKPVVTSEPLEPEKQTTEANIPQSLSTTSTPVSQDIDQETTEPDKGLNTVPSDEDMTEPSYVEKTTSSEETKVTELPSVPSQGADATTESSIEDKTTSHDVKATEPALIEDLTVPSDKKEGSPEPPFEVTTMTYEEESTKPAYIEPEILPSESPVGVTAESSIENETTPTYEVKATEPSIVEVMGSTLGDVIVEESSQPSFEEEPKATDMPIRKQTETSGIAEMTTAQVTVLREGTTEPIVTAEQTTSGEKDAEHSPELEATKAPAEQDMTPSKISDEDTELPAAEATTPREELQVTDLSTDTEKHFEEPLATTIKEDITTTEPVLKKEEGITTDTTAQKETEQPAIAVTSKYEPSSAETIAPFLDHDIVSTTAQLPEQHDLEGSTPSWGPTTESFMELSTFAHVTEKESPTTHATEKLDISETTTLNPEENEIGEEMPHLPSPDQIPGEGDCLVNGITYNNNSVVPSTNKCHSGCKCFSSIIKCDPIICSPPPDYMDNCQVTYDTPDSCCPTYVCDHSKETIPPQPHSQMSGTESPETAPVDGDDFGLKEEIAPPTTPSKISEICDSEGCTAEQPAQIPTEEQPEQCSGDNCAPPTTTCTGEKCEIPPTKEQPQVCESPDQCKEVKVPLSQSVPCDGESCVVEKEQTQPCDGEGCESKPVEVVPQVCSNEEECKESKVPEVSTPPCEGESCIVGKEQAQPCEDEGCEIKPVEVVPQVCSNEEECKESKVPEVATPPCEGESCVVDKEQAQPCEGEGCEVNPVEVIPQVCSNDEECKESKIPEVATPPCEGESCVLENKFCTEQGGCDQPQQIPCEGEQCEQKPEVPSTDEHLPVTPVLPCEGDLCVPPSGDCADGKCTEVTMQPQTTEQGEVCSDESCRRQEPADELVPPDCFGNDCITSMSVPSEETTPAFVKEPVTEQDHGIPTELPVSQTVSDLEVMTTPESDGVTTGPEDRITNVPEIPELATKPPKPEIQKEEQPEPVIEGSGMAPELYETPTERYPELSVTDISPETYAPETFDKDQTELPESTTSTGEISQEHITQTPRDETSTKLPESSETNIDDDTRRHEELEPPATSAPIEGETRTELPKQPMDETRTELPEPLGTRAPHDEIPIGSVEPITSVPHDEAHTEVPESPVTNVPEDESKTEVLEVTATKEPQDKIATELPGEIQTESPETSVTSSHEDKTDLPESAITKVPYYGTSTEIFEEGHDEKSTESAITSAPQDETTSSETSKPQDETRTEKPQLPITSLPQEEEETTTGQPQDKTELPEVPVTHAPLDETRTELPEFPITSVPQDEIRTELPETPITTAPYDESQTEASELPGTIDESHSELPEIQKMPEEATQTVLPEYPVTRAPQDETYTEQPESLIPSTPLQEPGASVPQEETHTELPESPVTRVAEEETQTIIPEYPGTIMPQGEIITSLPPDVTTEAIVKSTEPEKHISETSAVTKVPELPTEIEEEELTTKTPKPEVEEPVTSVGEEPKPELHVELTTKVPEQRKPEEEIDTSTKSEITNVPATEEEEYTESPEPQVTFASEHETKATEQAPQQQEEETQTKEPSSPTIRDEYVTSVAVSTTDEEQIQTESPLSLVTKQQTDTTTSEPHIYEHEETPTTEQVIKQEHEKTEQPEIQAPPESHETPEISITEKPVLRQPEVPSAAVTSEYPPQEQEVSTEKESITKEAPVVDMELSTEPAVSSVTSMAGLEKDETPEKVSVSLETEPLYVPTIPSFQTEGITTKTAEESFITEVPEKEDQTITPLRTTAQQEPVTQTPVLPEEYSQPSKTEEETQEKETTPTAVDEVSVASEPPAVPTVESATEVPTTQVQVKESDTPVTSAAEILTEGPEPLITEKPVYEEIATKAPELEEPTETKIPEEQTTATPNLYEMETEHQEQQPTKEPEMYTTEQNEFSTPLKEYDIKHEEPQTDVAVSLIPDEEATTSKATVPSFTEIKTTQSTLVEETVLPLEISTKSPIPESPHDVPKSPEEPLQTVSPEQEISETTPYLVELEEHTHIFDISDEETSTSAPSEEPTTARTELHETDHGTKVPEISTELSPIDERQTETSIKITETPLIEEAMIPSKLSTPEVAPEKTTETSVTMEEPTTSLVDKFGYVEAGLITRTQEKEQSTPVTPTEPETAFIPEDTSVTEKDLTVKPIEVGVETTAPEEEFIPASTKATTSKVEPTTQSPIFDKFTKPDEKPSEISASEPEVPSELQPTDEVPPAEDESHFPPSGGYGQEPDYGEEDQAFGPGTCRYGGKVYVSAQQIPRDDPCDFCFCFRSDIICLQQSCPPPIHGCHEEPIQGFCCPRYECPVAMATTLNVTTTTTTTTTTLPPHFLPHAYKGAAQRRGCQIKGHTYKVGEVVRASSGPCLHCTCGGDGQMKCDPKACTPEPMLRQMIAAAVSAKRRR